MSDPYEDFKARIAGRYVGLDPQTVAYYAFLDGLRESGVVNMHGAGRYLEANFGVDRFHAREILGAWKRWFKPLREETH